MLGYLVVGNFSLFSGHTVDTTTGENMATIRKRRGKYSVSIRRLFHKPIYKTFSKYEDGKRWASDSERQLERGLYEDLTEASRTT